ncbi:MAG TPA: VWA domain-containing protein [Vicinamibacterales bacterium]|nr:VWA domain-containing protein [Vicinamibacterales bacterium]
MLKAARGVSLLAALLAAAVSSIGAQQQLQQPPPTFRSRITLVPIDVRVLDRNGRPVIDLRQEDFTISEDGVPQRIVHFSFSRLEPTPAAGGPPELRKAPEATLSPPTHRTFLFVLGRGRQVGPGKDVRAAIDFMRNRLLPQDQVAILAYNRTTPFTTDHAAAARTLESYWTRHERIEAKLEHHFSGLAAAYADPEIPPHIQRLVDEIFHQPGVLRARHVTPGDISDLASYEEEITRNLNTADADAAWIEAGLTRNSPTMRDVENLYAGITYMRYLEGEKHLVFLTPQGLQLGRLENATTLARLASDARVAVDVVHTYGMIGAPPATTRASFSVPTAGMVFNQRFKVENSRHMSDLTGGETAAFKYGSATFARLDQTTRAQYLLGYSPDNANWDGTYRRVKVTVKRPNVTVLYRHGYYGQEQVTPLDRRRFMTYTRITAAANYYLPISDIKLTLRDPVLSTTPGGFVVTARAHIAPGALPFDAKEGLHRASLEAVFTCGDKRERLVGDVWQTLEFALTEANYQRFLRDGLSFDVRVPVTSVPRHLKVVVYDYATDAIGSMSVELPKK